MLGRRGETEHGPEVLRTGSPGLAFARVLSRADFRPIDAVAWASRELRLRGGDDEPDVVVSDVEMPGEWSTAAAVAFLQRHGARDLREVAPGAERVSVRRVMEELLEELRREGLAQGVFATEADAEVFLDELSVLLLTQSAALRSTRARDGASWVWSAAEGGPVRADATGQSAGATDEQLPRLWSVEDPATRQGLGQRPVPESLLRGVLMLPDGLLLEAAGEGDGGRRPGEEAEFVEQLCRVMAEGAGPAVSFQGSVQRSRWTPRTGGLGALLCTSRCAGTLNLLRFVLPDGEMDLPALRHAATLMVTALEIRVNRTPQPSEERCRQAHAQRTLGLGVANAGAMLMSGGVPYDSGVGRAVTAAVMAVVTGEGLRHSARMAEVCPPVGDGEGATGAFPRYGEEAEACLRVVRQGRAELFRSARGGVAPGAVPDGASGVLPFRRAGAEATEEGEPGTALGAQLPALVQAAREAWDAALVEGERFGFRNAGVSALEPADPLCAEMDCEAAGVQPEPDLVIPERREGEAGGAQVRVAAAAGLFRLGYSAVESETIQRAWESGVPLDRTPFLRPVHRAVFACAPVLGAEAALRMMEVVQPYLHACNAQEVTMPAGATMAEVRRWLLAAWRGGVRSLRLLGAPGAGEAEAGPEAGEQGAEQGGERMRRGAGERTAGERGAAERAAGERAAGERGAGERGAGERGQVLPIAPERAVRNDGGEERAMASAAASTPNPGGTEAEQTRESGDAGPGRKPTLAEAEQALLTREHAALMEVQMQRIYELEVQVLQLRQAATASADAFDAKEPPRSVRHRLPAERASVTHKFAVAEHEGYITVGLYPNGSPGEIFLRMTRENSIVAGLLDAFAMTASLALQHGTPLQALVVHLREMRFEPAGETANAQIPYARSIMEYLCRWLELRFLSGDQMDLFGNLRLSGGEGAIPVTGTVASDTGRVVPRPRPVPPRES